MKEWVYLGCIYLIIAIISIIFWWVIIAGFVKWRREKNAREGEEHRIEWDRKRKIDELLYQDKIGPLKAEIRTIITSRMQNSHCKCKHSPGFKLIRTSATYVRHSHTEHLSYSTESEYIDKDGERWPTTVREDYDRDIYEYSSLDYQVEVLCVKCGRELLWDHIQYDDEINDDDKESRFKNYKEKAEISIDKFLEDITPISLIYNNNLSAYDKLLTHLRSVWK